ncbi:hypothetical protein DFJ74DRAFT_727838 [Hyaloraphidium curvatum]|nr:hypothetical protein DFJ74DRAFT_727838 [Hyaloraphidium curvatum]
MPPTVKALRAILAFVFAVLLRIFRVPLILWQLRPDDYAAAGTLSIPLRKEAPRPPGLLKPYALTFCSCWACGAPRSELGADARLRRCKSCGTAVYCGPACQEAHWEQHKPICSALLHLRDFVWAALCGAPRIRIEYTHGPLFALPHRNCQTVKIGFDEVNGTLEMLVLSPQLPESRELGRRISARLGRPLPDAYADALNTPVQLTQRAGLVISQSIVLQGPRLDPHHFTPASAESADARAAMALAGDLGLQFLHGYSRWRPEPGHAVLARPDQRTSSLAALKGYKKNARASDLKAADVLARIVIGDSLHRIPQPAPMHVLPGALLHTPRGSVTGSKEQQGVIGLQQHVAIDAGHPGPFFALPGDELVTFLFCACPTGSPALGLSAGGRPAVIDINTATGGFRMLTKTGWTFGAIGKKAIRGFVKVEGPRCPECEAANPVGPRGWTWEKRPLFEERLSLNGSRMCGAHGRRDESGKS